MVKVITPKGKLDLAAAAGLHSEIGALKGQDLVIDFHDTTQMGALCLQVLIAGCKTAGSAGKTFCLTNVSDRVAGHFEAMGMPFETLTESLA